MLEYVFFTPEPSDKFITFLKSLSVPHTLPEGSEIITIEIPENLDETLVEKIEAYYDDMMEYGAKILSQQTGDGQINTAGITVTLSDGRVSYATLNPDLINKILSVLEVEELNTFVCAIADAVENPNNAPLCKRTKE